jgi:glycosyltransferase involved in cell wall biosynthesis
VILPVYNRETMVARAIESVLAQTYRPLELIVVDDGSTDGTRAVLDSFADRITLLSQPHGGAYVARNHAMRHARGELVAFIDSDDAWLPERLALQVPLLRRPEVGLVFGNTVHRVLCRTGAPACRFDRTGEGARPTHSTGEGACPTHSRRMRTSFRVSPPHRGRVAARFAWANFVPTVTVLARRSCIDEVGGFSEESEISCDYLMWFRIALRHEIDYVDEVVAEYTVHAGGISYDLGRSLKARIRLFSNELKRTADAATRAVLRLLLLNLSLRLVYAAMRGR